MKNSGLTNSGLDSLSKVGVSMTSKSAKNDMNDMASITEEILKQYGCKHVPQFTFDNLDIRINGIIHHLTLNYLEFEQHNTSHLSSESKLMEDMPNYFKTEMLILSSDVNFVQGLFDCADGFNHRQHMSDSTKHFKKTKLDIYP